MDSKYPALFKLIGRGIFSPCGLPAIFTCIVLGLERCGFRVAAGRLRMLFGSPLNCVFRICVADEKVDLVAKLERKLEEWERRFLLGRWLQDCELSCDWLVQVCERLIPG